MAYQWTWYGLMLQLRDLLEHGADILLPVKVKEEWKPGTIVDFAHEAFKQVHCSGIVLTMVNTQWVCLDYLEATMRVCLYSICGDNGEKMEGRCLRAWTKFTEKKNTTDQKLNDVYCLNKMLKMFNFPWNEEDTHYCTCFRVPNFTVT